MAAAGERKLFLGVRLKRMRRELGLTQTRMAQDLGVSPSYLNHLERNQRPLTAQVLLRLAQTYDIDMRELSSDADAAGAAGPRGGDGRPHLPRSRHPTPRDRRGGRERAGRGRRHRAALPRLVRPAPPGRPRGRPREGRGRRGQPSDWVRDHIQASATSSPNSRRSARRWPPNWRPEPARERTAPPPSDAAGRAARRAGARSVAAARSCPNRCAGSTIIAGG